MHPLSAIASNKIRNHYIYIEEKEERLVQNRSSFIF